MRLASIIGGAACIGWLLAARADAQVLTNVPVNATDNLLGAGHSGAAATPSPGGFGGGTPATEYTLAPGTARILTFSSVTGVISFDVGNGDHFGGPDGHNFTSANILSFNGVAGIQHFDLRGFLAGVFLGPTEPADPAPARLAFSNAGGGGSIATSFTSLAAELNQTFFIGDGLTGTGSGAVQQFLVPDAASRLYLGFADAPFSNGPPGAYGDNFGTLTASFTIASVPEPGSLLMTGLGLCGLFRSIRRASLRPVLGLNCYVTGM